MFSLPTFIVAALVAQLGAMVSASPAPVSITSLDDSGSVAAFYAATDPSLEAMQYTYTRVVWATEDHSQLSFEQVSSTSESVVLATLVNANDDLVKYLNGKNMIYVEDSEDGLVERSGPCGGGPNPGRKRDFDFTLESLELQKRDSRCGQFCGSVSDCTGDPQCPRCTYTGGKCDYQKSCSV
jgi:hypothetical protein